jgi:Cu-processing system permease protein
MNNKERGSHRLSKDTVGIIAKHELLLNVRSAWTVIFAVIFGVLVAAIAYFGLRAEGFSGVQGFARTSISLLNLVLYIVPLVAVTMGVFSFTGDRSSIELLFSQPVLRSEILLGKLLGLFSSLALSTFIGFGVAGAIITPQAGSSGISGYLVFVGLSLLLGLVFLCLSLLVATLAQQRMKAFGIAIFAWFFFVVFYDLVVIGVTTLLRGSTANLFAFVSPFANPVDMIRITSLIALDGVSIFGASGVALLRFLGGPESSLLLLVSILGIWVLAPLLISLRLIGRQDI